MRLHGIFLRFIFEYNERLSLAQRNPITLSPSENLVFFKALKSLLTAVATAVAPHYYLLLTDLVLAVQHFEAGESFTWFIWFVKNEKSLSQLHRFPELLTSMIFNKFAQEHLSDAALCAIVVHVCCEERRAGIVEEGQWQRWLLCFRFNHYPL